MRFLTSTPTGQRITICGFIAAAAAIVLVMLGGTQVHVPLINEARPYHVDVILEDSDNLVPAGDVRMAGVHVGDVESIDNGEHGATAKLRLDSDVAPLHDGVRVRVGEKSVVGETYLEIIDGNGAVIPAGAQLPKDVVQPSTQLHDLLRSLDAPTRTSLGHLIRSLGAATEGTRADTAALVRGLGLLGANGHTALDAIAAQSDDLRELTRQTTTVLAALDTGEGQIADLVSNARTITGSISGQRAAVEKSMLALPSTLRSTRTASGSLSGLAESLAPVAVDLRRSAVDLRAALSELPSTTNDLRALLPSLDASLRRAPATLDRVPSFGRDVRALIPDARAMLTEVNPMLAYLKPYGPDIAAWIANFSAVLQYTDEAGVHYARLQPLVNEAAVQSPLNLPLNVRGNPYPAPGKGGYPGPYQGRYPLLEPTSP